MAERSDGTTTATPPRREVLSDDEAVSVNVDDLVVGRVNQFPIHDRRNVLLLNSGQVITERLKRRLKLRNVAVLVHVDDVERMTDGAGGRRPRAATRSEPEAGGRTLRFDPGVRGPRAVSNPGAPLAARMVDHGPKRYDEAHRSEMTNRMRIVVRSLQEMINGSLSRGVLNESGVLNTTTALMTDLLADRDSALTVPIEIAESDELARHCVGMSALGMGIAMEMGLNEENVHRVGVAGLVHDWGMIRVPAAIRAKSGPLSLAETLEIKKHPVYAVDIVERATAFPSLVPLVVHQVHERMDGQGYPRGRGGENIHLFARILHVADKFVALRSARPTRRAVSPYATIRTLLEHRTGSALDPTVMRALLQVTALFPIGSFVVLSDGSVARVLRSNHDRYDSPVVEILRDGRGTVTGGHGDLVDLRDTDVNVVRALPTPGENELHSLAGPTGLRELEAARN